MQIHELNSATPAATDSIAMDNGMDTYRATPTTVVSNSAPTFTTGDASSPTAWESVSTISSGLGFGTLLNRITTMIKNVRYLYSKQGNTALTTTATTITGAINEHETDITATNTLMGDTSISGVGDGTVTGAISSINSSLSISSGTFTFENCRSNGSAIYRIGKIVYFRIDVTATANISPGSAGNGFIQFPSGFRPNAGTAFFGMDASAGTAKQMFVTSGGAASQTPSTIASGNVYRSSGMFIIP